MFSQSGEVCNRVPVSTVIFFISLVWRIRNKDKHQAVIMGLSTPGMVNLTAHMLVLVHKTKEILAVTMELSIIRIWHIASASNLAQR